MLRASNIGSFELGDNNYTSIVHNYTRTKKYTSIVQYSLVLIIKP